MCFPRFVGGGKYFVGLAAGGIGIEGWNVEKAIAQSAPSTVVSLSPDWTGPGFFDSSSIYFRVFADDFQITFVDGTEEEVI